MANFLSNLFGGTPARQEQVPRFPAQQQEAISTILQQALSQLQQTNRPTQEVLEPVFGLARQRFQEQTIPQLLHQFNAAGQFGSGRLQGALSKAGSDLEAQLAALGAQAELGERSGQRQQISQLLGLGLTPQFDTIERPREPGLGEEFTTSLGGNVGAGFGRILPFLLGGLLGGPAGAAAGGGTSVVLEQILKALGGK